MKKFNIYHGIKYTFKDKKFNRNLSEITDYYLEILKKVTRIKSIQELLKLIPVKNDNLILKEMESLGHLFKIDDTKVYSIKRFNKILLKRFKNNKNMKEVQEIKNIIDNIENNNYQYVKKIGLIKPKILIDSIYIYLLKEV